MYPLAKYLFWSTALVVFVAVLGGLGLEMNALWQSAAAIGAVVLAIGFRFIPKLRGYQFTAWIIAAVVCAMIYPQRFLRIGDFDLRNKWLILLVVQAVMFGMGTQMKIADFKGVVRMPWAVFVGVLCQNWWRWRRST
jgi:BASS family bile acid:Na+ symporter